MKAYLENLNRKFFEFRKKTGPQDWSLNFLNRIEKGRLNILLGSTGWGKTSLLERASEKVPYSSFQTYEPSLLKQTIKENIYLGDWDQARFNWAIEIAGLTGNDFKRDFLKSLSQMLPISLVEKPLE